jgi:hypothetical protein
MGCHPMDALAIVSLRSGWYFLERVVHSLSVLSCKPDHFVSASRGTAYAKAAIAFGDQAAGDGMKDLVEHRISDSG